MSEHDFQHEVLTRLGYMEADIKGLKTELNGWRDRLDERCYERREQLETLRHDSQEIHKRLEQLEQREHQRRGGQIVVGALLAAAGAICGLVAKWVNG